jgi:HAE1 family hydrophobic/amphiphilic exporter-1
VTFSEIFIRRPVMTVLLSASCVIAGLIAYADIPIAALPKFDTPTIQVTATLPGASPENMAASVASPLEKQFEHDQLHLDAGRHGDHTRIRPGSRHR